MQGNFEDQFYRRAFVRALFAFIEADVWGRKMVALYLHQESEPKPLMPEEVLIASETPVPELKDDGSVRTTELRLRFLPNLRFSFRTFARAFHVEEFNLAVGDNGWAELRKAVEIRDRLMHPKGGNDFTVSDRDVEVCRGALIWYDKEASRLNELAAAQVESDD
jgi:hypothetical protein